MCGGEGETVALLPLGDGEIPNSLPRSPPIPSYQGEAGVPHYWQLRMEVQAEPQVLLAIFSKVVFVWIKVVTIYKFCLGRLPFSWSFG